MERDQLEAHLILQWDQLYAQYNHLIVERDLLQREVNQLKRDRAEERGYKHFILIIVISSRYEWPGRG